MKMTNVYAEYDKLALQTESFFKSIPKKYREEIGIMFCQEIATFSTMDSSKIFAPLSILATAQKKLQSVIAEVVDDEIVDQIKEHIKANPQ